mmetsp:Transcript_1477/g.3088  ORF Transcript_1477/g.3088 Transcript_1477/m.3088 type:complete len:88 (-) Transcript_1477:196-459(-)
MLFERELNWHLRKPCLYFVRTPFRRLVSILQGWLFISLVIYIEEFSFFILFFCHEASLMSTVYEEQKDEDGFLYVQYSGESTFGLNS